jgi:hypothetical protein
MNKQTLYIIGGLAVAFVLYKTLKKGSTSKSSDKSASSSTPTPSSYKNEDEKFKAVMAEVEKQGAKTKEEAEVIMKKMGVTMAEFDAWMKKSMEAWAEGLAKSGVQGALQGVAQSGAPKKAGFAYEEANFAFGGHSENIL